MKRTENEDFHCRKEVNEMSIFRDRVKSKNQRHKKGHQRRATEKAKRGALMHKSWDDIKRRERNE